MSIARATRDIDLLGRGDPTPDEIARMIADCIAVVVPPDAVVFDPASIETSEIREQERYGGTRATFLAHLERARIKMQVDVGIGDVVTPGVVAITFTRRLRLAPAPELAVVVEGIRNFALPLFAAANKAALAPGRWSPARGWSPTPTT